MRTTRTIGAFVILAGLFGCSGSEAVQNERLLILAASSVELALEDMVQEFERRTGTEVDIVLGSSGNLAAQIENGAPADLFLSADRGFVDRLEEGGHLVPGTKRDYATGRIALVVAPGRRLPEELIELRGPEYSVVAIANPETAPYGLAARQSLATAGIWDALSPRIVFSENVAQVAQFVLTGNADAGILALSVVLQLNGLEHRPIDASLHAPIIQAAGAIAGSEQVEVATDLLDLITSPDGTAILTRHGFGVVGGS